MEERFNSITVVIPAYQPAEQLTTLIDALLPFRYQQIVVVNDGSSPDKDKLFQQIAAISQVTVLTHSKNQGKGAALQTAFEHILKSTTDLTGIVTADADGQHLAQDVAKVAAALIAHPEQLVLGVRQFEKQIPWRSRFGNNLTRTLFRWRYHINLTDTQTGLRGIPLKLISLYTTIPLKHYEFEMACLLLTVQKHYKILQVPIQTVYLEQNLSSHFHPIVDSIRIYYIFLRFCLGQK